MQKLRLTLFFILLLAVTLFFALDLGQYLTLAFINQQRSHLTQYYAAHPVLAVFVFAAIYILVTALSLPGAAILTLAGGALFGFGTAVVTISFASTLGATGAFLIARLLLGQAVQNRYADRLAALNAGIEKEGAFYLFTLRLVPLFPFFLVNILMGLTPIKTWTFYWVSQLGMLPATLIFVNAGDQLGRIESVSGILTPSLLLSLIILGLFPLTAKKTIALWQRRRHLKRFYKPRRYDYNVIVIGGGSAGLVAAYVSALLKAKVALIERDKMGGDCLNTGCVPSKAFIRAAKTAAQLKRAHEFGFTQVVSEINFSRIINRVHATIGRIAPHDSVERYTALGVDCLQGEAKVLSPYEVAIGERRLTTRSIILATGARPVVPDIAGLENIAYHTSETIWSLQALPQRLVIVGGGPIGCELAQCFARLGTQVFIVERGAQLLGREDAAAAAVVQQGLQQEGVTLYLNSQAKQIMQVQGKSLLLIVTNGKEQELQFDEILLAAGRKPATENYGLEELGVTLIENGAIAADQFLRTNFSNIYACGDVTGPFQYTHAASYQAASAAMNALFAPFKNFPVNYRTMPHCTYTDPQVARVGLNEKEAVSAGISYEVTQYELSDLDRAIIDGELAGFVKVLTTPGKNKILGVTIVGSQAGEMIAEWVLAMKHGLDLDDVLNTIHAYPSFNEANKHVAGAWKKTHAPSWLWPKLQKFHSWRRK